MSVRAFEISISASDGMIRRAINNNSDIQSKWLSIIADNYPNLNLDWLITGRGSMLRVNEQQALLSDKVDSVLPIEFNGEASAYARMYKEEREENKILNAKIAQLSAEIGSLRAQVNQQESPGLEEIEAVNVATTEKTSFKHTLPAKSANAH